MNNMAPIILIPAAIFLLLPIKNSSLIFLRHIVTLYLFFLVMDQASQYSFKLPLSFYSVRLFASIPILLTGLVVWRITKKPCDSQWHQAWIFTIILITVHLFFLFPLLQLNYGYGSSRSPYILGRLIFFLFLFIFFQQTLCYFYPRLILAVAVILSGAML